MKKFYDYEVFTKDEKGKWKKVNELKEAGCYILADMCSYHERKVDGEKIRIVKKYNYRTVMDIDVYFNNGYKYSYYDVPCTSGAYIDSSELLKGDE